MHVRQLRGVCVDVCREGDGIWLDYHEIEQALKLNPRILSARSTRAVLDEVAEGAASHTLYHSVGYVVDVILDVLFSGS